MRVLQGDVLEEVYTIGDSAQPWDDQAEGAKFTLGGAECANMQVCSLPGLLVNLTLSIRITS